MPGRLEFGVQFKSSHEKVASPGSGDDPLRILVLGDFSGQAPDGKPSLADRPIQRIDIDSFDEVFGRLTPQVEVRPGSSRQPLVFNELDDFHPDRLYRRLDLFAGLRELRNRLDDPATFDDAARELMRTGLNPPVGAGSGELVVAGRTDAQESGEATLERLLGKGQGSTSAVPERSAGTSARIDALLRHIVAPHLEASAPNDSAPYLDAIDSAVTEQMRAVLHDADFQSLEAGWRGIRWLVENLDLDVSLRLSVLDLSKEELIADARLANETIRDSALFGMLVERPGRPSDEPPWSVIVGNYSFGPGADELRALELMGSVGARLGATFLAAAAPALAGCDDLEASPDPRDWQAAAMPGAEQWNELRKSEAAAFIGLAMPRILMRLPYGEKTDPIDAFEFDEFGGAREHDHFLWGNPAFACAMLLGRAFEENDWEMRLGENLEIDDLPAFSFEQGGEIQLKPCSEVYLSRDAGQALLERGIMPFLSYANRNAVRLMGFRSISDSAPALAGLSPSDRP